MSVISKIADGVFEGLGEMGLWTVVRKAFGHSGHDHDGGEEDHAHKVGGAIGRLIAMTLNDARALLVPFFMKLMKSGNERESTAGRMFFAMQAKMQQHRPKPATLGGNYRPGDENHFMTLLAKLYIAMEPATSGSTTEISLTIDGKDKDADAVKKAALIALRKELEKRGADKTAVVKVTAEKERLEFFVELFNQPEEAILEALEAVNHDVLEQFVLRMREDIATFNAEGQRRLDALRTNKGLQPWGKAPWRR